MDRLTNTENLDNLAVVLHGKDDIRLEQWPIEPTLDSHECLLQAQSCGICGTDITLWKKGFVADFVVKKPYVLGHEPSALVLAVGSEVTHLKPGDRVAVEPALPCLKCDFCRNGRYNLCPISNQQSHGLPPADGTLRRYYCHRADFCYKLPENVSYEEGALVEALAVVVHACRRVDIRVGHKVLICGAGPVGIMAVLCAKAFGATKVFVTDIVESRLNLAKQMGADGVYLIDPKNFEAKQVAKQIREQMGGPPEVTIECSGVESSVYLAVFATKSGGKVGIVGLGADPRVPLSSAAMREVDLIGVCRIKDDYQLAIELISSGKLDVKPLITHKFKIEDAIQAFNLLKSGSEGVVKVLIQY